MKTYSRLTFGRYDRREINTIPIDYLMWLLPVMRRSRKDQSLYLEILSYFLSKDIRIEAIDNYYGFFFNDYLKLKPNGGELPFLRTQRLTNSKGDYIYEFEHLKNYMYIQYTNEYEFTTDCIAHSYLSSGLPMVYEKNTKYYFIDGYGRTFNNSYLIRKPQLFDKIIENKFSNNIILNT